MAAEAKKMANGAHFDFDIPDFEEADKSQDELGSTDFDPELEAFLRGEEAYSESEQPHVTEPVDADMRNSEAAAMASEVVPTPTQPEAAVSANNPQRVAVGKAIAIGVAVSLLVLTLGASALYVMFSRGAASANSAAPVALPQVPATGTVKAVANPLPSMDLPQPKVPDLQMPEQLMKIEHAPGGGGAQGELSAVLPEPVQPSIASAAPVPVVASSNDVQILSADVPPQMIDALRQYDQAQNAAANVAAAAEVQHSPPAPTTPTAAPPTAVAAPAPMDSDLLTKLQSLFGRMADVEAAVIRNADSVVSLEKATRETAQSIVALRTTMQAIQSEQGSLRTALNANKQRIASLEAKLDGSPRVAAVAVPSRPTAIAKAAPVQPKVEPQATPIDHYVITAITDNGAIVKHRDTQEVVILLKGREVQGLGRIVEVNAARRQVIVESNDGKRWRIGAAA